MLVFRRVRRGKVRPSEVLFLFGRGVCGDFVNKQQNGSHLRKVVQREKGVRVSTLLPQGKRERSLKLCHCSLSFTKGPPACEGEWPRKKKDHFLEKRWCAATSGREQGGLPK